MKDYILNIAENPIFFMKQFSILLLLTIPPWIALRGIIINKIKSKNMITRLVLSITFIGYMVASYYLENLPPFIVVMIYFVLKKKSKDSDEESYYLRPLYNKKLEIFLYALSFKIGITIVNILYVFLLKFLGLEPKQQEITQLFMNSSWKLVVILSIMTTIIAPILEEFIFRHIFYRKLSERFGKVFATVFTSLLFMLVHFNIAGSIAFFGVGVYNCYLYEKHGYRAAVVSHFVFNFTSTFLMIIGIVAKNLGYF